MRRYIPRRSEGALCTSWMRFKHIEPQRTVSNYILTEIARYLDFFHTRSGWCDWTDHSLTTSTGDSTSAGCSMHRFGDWIEPPLTASVQGIEGVSVLYALVGGGSNLL